MDSKRSEFQLQPNSSRTFIYDWDDIQFSEILVRRPTGSYHFLATGLDPVEGQYSRPEEDRFIIAYPDALPAAGEDMLLALPGNSGRVWTIYILAGLGMLSPFFFTLARKKKAKTQQAG